jgi:hypothetical protein
VVTDKQIRGDMAFLMGRPEFRRFLWRVIQTARIFEPVTDGSDTRYLYHEGRRDLGLELLAECEAGQPAQHPSGTPILTVIQVLREEAQQQPTETQNGRRDRYDRTAELAGDGEPESDGEAG